MTILEEIGDRYGLWRDKECRVMKNALVKMETPMSMQDGTQRNGAESLSKTKQAVELLKRFGCEEELQRSWIRNKCAKESASFVTVVIACAVVRLWFTMRTMAS